jgi:DNA-binding winged helix-turn-helix (wHTH) protein
MTQAMKLLVTVIESVPLYSRVLTALGPTSKELDRELLRRSGIEASVHFAESPPVEAEISCAQYDFRLFVISGDNTARARLKGPRREPAPSGSDAAARPVTPPVIAVLGEDANLQWLARDTGPVDQWLFSNFGPGELAFRILRILTYRQSRMYRFGAGTIGLSPRTRTMEFNDKKVKLSPSELTLAELFLSKPGSVISLQDLVAFFTDAGKSSGLNNIRVTICQLRLKLEELSNSQWTILAVHRRGYSLRQAAPPALAANTNDGPRDNQLERILGAGAGS